MRVKFDYTNIDFKKHDSENWLVVKGDIINRTGRDYQSVVFIITVFARNIPLGKAKMTINGFSNWQTRTFETKIEELEYRKIMRSTLNCEIEVENWY